MTGTDVKPTDGKMSRLMRAARKCWSLAVDPAYRHVIWTFFRQRMGSRFMRRRQGAYQIFNYTRENRYPRIFRFVQSELGAESEINILSYGCSTGEEVFSLRSYFPRAGIKGLDIDERNIAVCRRRLKRLRDLAISFEATGSAAGERAGYYDAIFCMAVLRHSGLGAPDVIRCDHLIRFEDFSQTVEDFERCLKPGGLLIIRHSNFRLKDAPAGAHFEAILGIAMPSGSNTPIFGPDNLVLREVTYPDTVFRKKC